MNNSTLCMTLFEHSTYYCHDCEWESLRSFSIVQFSLGLIVILTNIAALGLISYRAFLKIRGSANDDSLWYWGAVCFGGVLVGTGHVAETSTLCAGEGPTVIGDKISHVAMDIAVNALIVLEAAYATKLVLGTWRMTLFASAYPSLIVVAIDWILMIVTSGLASVLAYVCNSCYMQWAKPLQMAVEWSVYTLGVIAGLGMIVYGTIKINRFCHGQQSRMYLSDRAQRAFWMATLRNVFHGLVLGIVMGMFLVLNIIHYYYLYADRMTSDACIDWLIPYKMLTIVYFLGKVIVAFWLFCSAGDN